MPAIVNAYTFRDNPRVREFPGYEESYPPHVYLKDDGRYELVALPGRGLITCQSDSRRYRTGVGAEAIPGDHAYFDTVPRQISSSQCHALAAVDLDPKAESATVDLQVDPGRSLMISVLDPEGQPLGGTKAAGIGDRFSGAESEQESSAIEIHALDPSKPRRVTITHAGRKLAGSVYLRGDETGPLTVRLQPWGTITGRIVGEDGQPRGGLALIDLLAIYPQLPADQGILPEGIRISHDGRFRIERLIPGLKYGASAIERSMGLGSVFRDVTVAPGEVKDLGDVKVIPPQRDGQS